jgi:hypothetical protein
VNLKSTMGFLGIASVLLALLSAISVTARAAQGSANKIVYEAPTRTSKIVIDMGIWSSSEVAPLALLPSEKRGMTYEVVGHEVISCSDSQYRCLESWGRTFAVPRVPLRFHQTYEKHGVKFHVEECLGGDARRCQVALISGICGHGPSLRAMRCLPTPRSGAGSQAVYDYVVYFLYNEDFGITAFGATDHVAPTEAGRLAIATQMILMSSTGLLRG